MDKKKFLFIITAVFFLALPANIQATQFAGTAVFTVPKGKVVEGDLFVGAGIINIDGVVTGDLFFGGNAVNVNGEVQGDIIGMGGSFTLNGQAGDDVRVWCQSVIINGRIKKSLTAFGATVGVFQKSVIGRDIYFGCGEARLGGEIWGEAKGESGIIQLSGLVGKSAKFHAGQINLHPNAKIRGNLEYSARNLDIQQGAVVEGKVNKIPARKESNKWLSWNFYIVELVCLFGAIVVGMVLIRLFPEMTSRVTRQVREYWKSLGMGFIVLICSPVLVIIMAITLIGIPLSIIILIIYLLFLYIGQIFVSIVVGQEILRSNEKYPFRALILGMVIYTVLCTVPFIGWLIKILIVILGFGAVYMVSVKTLKKVY